MSRTAAKHLPPLLQETIARAGQLVALERPIDLLVRDASDALWRAVVVVERLDEHTLRWGLRMTGAGRAFVVRFPSGAWCHYHATQWHEAPAVPGWVVRLAREWLAEHDYAARGVKLSLPGVV